MRLACWITVAWLVLGAGAVYGGPGPGEPLAFRVATRPASAEIYLRAPHSGSEEYLGTTDRPIFLSPTRFQGRSSVHLVLRAAGYLDKQEVVPIHLLQQGSYPERGTVRLQPVAWWARLREWPAWLVPLVLSGLVLGGWGLSRNAEAIRRLRRAEEASEPPGAGFRIGRYRLVEPLGRGGMGRIYRAVHETELQDGHVAIKILDPDHLRDPEFRSRFWRECQVCREFSHPNIVQVRDVGMENGRCFLVMEYLEGSTLRSRIGRLSDRQARDMLLAVMAALSYAHERGVVHRDLKPENVMMAPDGTVKVMDFGLARRFNDSEELTRTGQMLGTPAYMAPEQVEDGRRAGPAADQYSVGVLAFEMLTGRLPFEERDPLAILLGHLAGEPALLRLHRPELAPTLEAVIARMLHKQPERRFPSVAAAALAFRVASAGLEGEAVSVGSGKKSGGME
ncbi:MAG: serine/threonine protein kinase [Armatimonadetes bacterium]|nr:serine/threonine protein kinase [Armatimonadota bacterium]